MNALSVVEEAGLASSLMKTSSRVLEEEYRTHTLNHCRAGVKFQLKYILYMLQP